MSEGDGLGPLGGARRDEMEIESPRRAASVTLRDEEEGGSRTASLEAAQRSLSDALRITYRLMQVLIAALVVLFLFSGFRQVGENQLAVKTRFGAVVERDIPPGFTIALPYPLGEVRTVSAADSTVEIVDAFFPELRGQQRALDFPNTGPGSPFLDPRVAGSLITGDQNLAHSKWRVTYRRDDATDYLGNLLAADEERLVRAAVQSAAVRVASGVPIEALVGSSLAGLSGEGGGNLDAVRPDIGIEEIQRRVRELAQRRLASIDSGLLISSVIALEPYPPRRVLRAFRRVDDAISSARRSVENAERQATSTLVDAAGENYEEYLRLIDLYEDAVNTGNDRAADRVLDAIHGAMRGEYVSEPLVLGGVEIGRLAPRGEASRLIERAESDVNTMLQRAEAEHRTYLVRLRQMRDDPAVFFARERADALAELFEDPSIQVTTFATSDLERLELILNRDPDIARRQEQERNRRERDEAIRAREEQVFGDR